MREIKFRAWDLADGYHNDEHSVIHFGVQDFVKGDYDVLEQYTGLKDKNGVEIYEGDILKALHFIDANKKKHYLYHRVEWCERLTGWQTIAKKQNGTENNGNPQLWVYCKNNDFEVIGSIHTNPELL